MPPRKIVGNHPVPDAFGSYTLAEDGSTVSGVPHRVLMQAEENRDETVAQLRRALIDHHVSPAMIARDQRKIEKLRVLGYPVEDAEVRRFPTVDKTRKGNLTEVFLAEYICSSSGSDLPIYRLRFNPNVEQSMKGDDVLAFDFTSKRPRIIVGEAKFRRTPTKKAVEEVVEGLVRSYQVGLPASLQFIADRLYEAGDHYFADRVEDCSLQMAQGNLDLGYVGLLLSSPNCKANVDRSTPEGLQNLVMVSLGVDNPSQLIADCFDGIEEEAYDDPA